MFLFKFRFVIVLEKEMKTFFSFIFKSQSKIHMNHEEILIQLLIFSESFCIANDTISYAYNTLKIYADPPTTMLFFADFNFINLSAKSSALNYLY